MYVFIVVEAEEEVWRIARGYVWVLNVFYRRLIFKLSPDSESCRRECIWDNSVKHSVARVGDLDACDGYCDVSIVSFIWRYSNA